MKERKHTTKPKKKKGLGMSFMAVPSMCEALGSILETQKSKERTGLEMAQSKSGWLCRPDHLSSRKESQFSKVILSSHACCAMSAHNHINTHIIYTYIQQINT